MKGWWLDPHYATGPAATLFGDLATVFALDGKEMAHDKLCQVLRVEADGQRFYVKRYRGIGKSARQNWFGLRRWLGPLRVRAEWRNLLAFRTWGIPTATVVAYGLERRFGGFTRGALVTAEIPATVDLAHLTLTGDARLRDRRWLAHVLHQVAAIARTLHAAGFAHNDLKWRNLLVDDAALPTVYLIDCPSGGFYRGAVLEYRIIKDLACLDKVAKYHLSRTQRLRFYLDYREESRLGEKDRKRIRKILHFFAGRE